MTSRSMRYLLAGLMGALVLGCSHVERGRGMKTTEIESMISKGVPVGSSSAQVIAFLDANHIEHSDYQADRRTIYGIIRNTSQGAMVKGSAQIEFHFDEKENLKDYMVKDVFTGP